MRLKMLLRSLRTKALCSAPTDATARTFRIRNDIKENEMIIRRIISHLLHTSFAGQQFKTLALTAHSIDLLYPTIKLKCSRESSATLFAVSSTEAYNWDYKGSLGVGYS